jgi:hypothetical protein
MALERRNEQSIHTPPAEKRIFFAGRRRDQGGEDATSV